MKTINHLLIASTILFSLSASAKSPVTLYVKAGPSFPVGDYAEGMDDNEAGLALTGTCMGIGAGYDMKQNIRLTVEIQNRKNPMDEKEMERFAASLDPTLAWQVKAESYNMTGVLIGFGSYTPETYKVILGFKASLGLFGFKTPAITMSATNDGMTESETIESMEATSSAFSVEMDFGYHFDKHHSLTLNPDYFAARPEFKMTDKYSNTTTKAEQKISTIGLALRYTYRF